MNSQIEEALKILKSGKPGAPDLALSTLWDAVQSFGMKVCGNPDDAEDTAQETLLRLSQSMDQFSDPRALAVWLYKVAKSQCLMSRRRSKFAPAQTLSLDTIMPGGADGPRRVDLKPWPLSPEEALLQDELRSKLKAAVHDLPEPYRLVLILRDREQLDTREVAEVMGIRPETVKMRLHRARVKVRNVLSQYFTTYDPTEAAAHE